MASIVPSLSPAGSTTVRPCQAWAVSMVGAGMNFPSSRAMDGRWRTGRPGPVGTSSRRGEATRRPGVRRASPIARRGPGLGPRSETSCPDRDQLTLVWVASGRGPKQTRVIRWRLPCGTGRRLRLEHLTDLDLARGAVLTRVDPGEYLEREPLGPFHGLVHRLDLEDPVTGDQLLGLGERPVDDHPVPAGELHPPPRDAREQPREVEEHAGLLELVVVAAHRGQELLAGHRARFRISLDHHHHPHVAPSFPMRPVRPWRPAGPR